MIQLKPNLNRTRKIEFMPKKLGIDLIPNSDAILKILSVDFYGKVKVNSNSSSKIV